MGSKMDLQCDLSDSFEEADGICSLNIQTLSRFSSSQSETPNKLIGSLTSRFQKSSFETPRTQDSNNSNSKVSKEVQLQGKTSFESNRIQFSSSPQKEASEPSSTKSLKSKDLGNIDLKSEALKSCPKSKETRYWIREDSFGNVKAIKVSEEPIKEIQPDIDSKKTSLRQKKASLEAYFNQINQYREELLIRRKSTSRETDSFLRVGGQPKEVNGAFCKLATRLQTTEATIVNDQEKGDDRSKEPLLLCKLSPISSQDSSRVRASNPSFGDCLNSFTPKKASLEAPSPKKVTFSDASNEIHLIPGRDKDYLRTISQLKRDQNQLNFTLIGILPNNPLGVDSE